jgi:hypothetical protein
MVYMGYDGYISELAGHVLNQIGKERARIIQQKYTNVFIILGIKMAVDENWILTVCLCKFNLIIRD